MPTRNGSGQSNSLRSEVGSNEPPFSPSGYYGKALGGIEAFKRLETLKADAQSGKQISLSDLSQAQNDLARAAKQAVAYGVVNRENSLGVRVGQSDHGFVSGIDKNDPSGQTYDRWIIEDTNGKKVTAAAKEALALVRFSSDFDKMQSGDIREFVNEYVKSKLPEGQAARFTRVKWNMKSYPD
jgi:hypothetical protein